MKRTILFIAIIALLNGTLCAQWKPAGDRIKSSWAEQLDPENVWPEYPRPIMERDDWKNLNGLWKYALTPMSAPVPGDFNGEILVPFAIESSLRGVQERVGNDSVIWYQRTFEVPRSWNAEELLLHFGAVDWQKRVISGLGTGTGDMYSSGTAGQ